MGCLFHRASVPEALEGRSQMVRIINHSNNGPSRASGTVIFLTWPKSHPHYHLASYSLRAWATCWWWWLSQWLKQRPCLPDLIGRYFFCFSFSSYTGSVSIIRFYRDRLQGWNFKYKSFDKIQRLLNLVIAEVTIAFARRESWVEHNVVISENNLQKSMCDIVKTWTKPSDYRVKGQIYEGKGYVITK